MVHSDEHAHITLHNGISWAVDSRSASLMAWLAVFKVEAAIWVLVVTQVVIFWPFGSNVIAVVDSDVAASLEGSGCGTGSWGGGCGTVDQPGIQCHHSGVAGDSGAEGKAVVVVDNDIGSIDGGCVAVVSDDMAVLGGVLGCSMRVCMAVSVVWGVVWVPKLTCASFGTLGFPLSCVSVCKVAHQQLGAAFVWEAISSVLVVVCVLVLLVMTLSV
jgi:hypothetical protein